WGIFFINFEPKRLPVVVLRRILRSLVIKKRQSANRAQQAAWKLHDLLFISSFGVSDERSITFAHFSESEEMGDLPSLRVLGWDDQDTPMHLEHAHSTLKEQLRWPEDEEDLNAWRMAWSSAFTLRYREVITTSKELAARLATLATRIRRRANSVLAIESERGPFRKLHEAFKESLVHDLKEDDFADMYAQTIAYGLLTARFSRPAGLVAENLVDMIPSTNPFLKDLLGTFLTLGGRKGKVDFDELGINEVVELLRRTDADAIKRDFGNLNPDEDPVIRFYEDFLQQYDAEKRIRRGIFFTPVPVVSFIVRSVHELLQTEFGLEDGLASTVTWGEMAKRHKGLKIPDGVSPDEPFVQILDIAAGTGTFMVMVIEVIYQTMTAKWKKQGRMELEFYQLWDQYVPKHLLPRLYGFELMMAPYAIAHMKIGLKLSETGYRFHSDERLRLYLTNTLEPPHDISGQLEFMAPALAHESKAVNKIKREKKFTVVIGNPPYAGISANNSETAVRLVDAYKVVDGEALGEKKLWLQDDYVKFIRFSQMRLDETRVGVLGFITNHGFLDNPTFRGMRQSLMESFPGLHVLDLHGNANKGERAPDGGEEQNVFEIKQGVAITLAVAPIESSKVTADHFQLWGLRAEKYKWLDEHSSGSTTWSRLTPSSPYRFLVPRNQDTLAEYQGFFPLEKVVRDRTVGMITARDALTIQFTRIEIVQTVNQFASLSIKEAREQFELGKDARDWSVERAQEDLRNHKLSEKCLRLVLYRPFDVRHTFYTGTSRGFIGQPQKRIMAHLDGKKNWALCISRFNRQKSLGYFFTTRTLTDFHLLDTVADSMTVFPLYLSANNDDQNELSLGRDDAPNFAPEFLTTLSDRLKIPSRQTSGLPVGLTPEDVFHYAYAVFHSPGYRSRYSEFLKIDFPRLPLTSSIDLFRALSKLGSELVALHLMESPKLDKHITKFVGKELEVEKVAYANDTVWIDKAQTSGFKGVPENVWEFHIGGYQVCQKWLKDRKGRTLTKEDIEHYNRIVVALNETIRLMSEIDKVIDEYGGWP
ncbi:MAG: type ISP restriction/modification enzyme, partial [Ignavibacteria bacterium]|nr:type ISP restriction/modification enzyme [Ignavibacteria bacterium]